MKRIALLVLLVALAAPSSFACEVCESGACTFGHPTGWFCQFLIGGGCINDGFCPDGALPLQAQYRVAAVHVIEQGKPVPPAKKSPARVLTAERR